MKKATTRRIFRSLATRSVLAALPVAMVSAYASNSFVPTPPRIASYEYQKVAEIVVAPSTVGIAASPLYGQSKAAIEAQLDDMLAIGVTSIRVFVPWGLVEYAPDTYDWQYVDNVITAAAARNMGVLAEINATPPWARATPLNPSYPPGSDTPNTAAFADFMKALISRPGYASTISAYEIWNEPNFFAFSNPINPEAYAALLKAVYPIIKDPNTGLDKTATVVAGALSTVQTAFGLTMNPLDFVRRMLAVPGVANSFDALSVHPYLDDMPYSGTCSQCIPGFLTPRQQVESLLATMAGVDKEVWITEYGISTPPGGKWTQAVQSSRIKDLLDTWQEYADDPAHPEYADLLGPIFLYTGRDTPNASNPNNDYLGLWDVNGNLKDAGKMLKKWLASQQPQPPQQPVDPVALFFGTLAQQLAQAIANWAAGPATPAPSSTSLAAESKLASAPETSTEAEGNGPALEGATTATQQEAKVAEVAAEEVTAEAEAPAAAEPTKPTESAPAAEPTKPTESAPAANPRRRPSRLRRQSREAHRVVHLHRASPPTPRRSRRGPSLRAAPEAQRHRRRRRRTQGKGWQ